MGYREQIKRNQLRRAKIYGGYAGAYTDAEGKSWHQRQMENDPQYQTKLNEWLRDTTPFDAGDGRMVTNAQAWREGWGTSAYDYNNEQKSAPAFDYGEYTINADGLAVRTNAAAPSTGTPTSAALATGQPQAFQFATVEDVRKYHSQVVKSATVEDVKTGKANWVDMSADDRKKILADPNFYKNGISQFDIPQQQQILADKNFQKEQMPDWMQSYHSFMSSPVGQAVMNSPFAAAGGKFAAKLPIPAPGPLKWAAGAGIAYLIGLKGGQDYNQAGGYNDQPTLAAKIMWVLNEGAQKVEQGVGYGLVAADMYLTGHGAQLNDAKNREALFEAGRNTWDYIGSGLGMENALPYAEAMWEIVKADWNDPSGKTRANIEEQYKKETGKNNLNPLNLLDFIQYQGKKLDPKLQFADAGEAFIVGQANPIKMQAGTVNGPFGETLNMVQAIVNDANYIKQEMEKGRSKNDVVNEVMMRAQNTVGGALGDFAGQVKYDPLDLVGPAISKGVELGARAAGDKVMAEAFKGKHSFVDAQKAYRSMAQTPLAKTIDPTFERTKLNKFQRWMGGLNSEGKIKAGGFTDAGVLDKVTPEDWKKKWMLFGEDPKSRAQTGLNLFSDNVTAFLSAIPDPKDAARYLRALANNDMKTWAELGSRFADSPEFYTVLPALKDFNASKLDAIAKVWEETTVNRDYLYKVANILGMEPGRLIDDLNRKGTAAQDFARVRDAALKSSDPAAKSLLADIEAGKFTEDTLKQTVDIFSGEGSLPWTEGMWKAEMNAALTDHFQEWAVKNFSLDQSPETKSWFFQSVGIAKSAQSLLLLGLSPNYAIQNGLSGAVHLAASGLYGFMLPGQIDDFFKRLGVTPSRLDEGVGIGGMKTDAGGAIADAVKPKGTLGSIKNLLGKIQGVMPMSKLSGWFEKQNGRQAYAIGMKKFWSNSWRAGVGFSEMPKALEAHIRAAGMNPEVFHRAIEAGMNQEEIARAFSGRQRDVMAASAVHDAAQRTGMSTEQARTMLETLGVIDQIDAYLKDVHDGKKTTSQKLDQVNAAFNKVIRSAQDMIDVRLGEELKGRAAAVAEKVGLEGALAGMDIARQVNDRYSETCFGHYDRLGDLFRDLDLLPDEQRNKAFDYAYKASDDEFRRVDAINGSDWLGVFDAWKLSGDPSAMAMLKGMADSSEAMKNAYQVMRDLRREHFNTKWDTEKAKWNNWDKIEREINHAFGDAFDAKKKADIAQGKALQDIYGKRYGERVGAAVKAWWEDTIKAQDEIVNSEKKFRQKVSEARYNYAPAEEIQAMKADYYGENGEKRRLMASLYLVNEDGIARVRRAVGDGGGSPAPKGEAPNPPSPAPNGEAAAPTQTQEVKQGAAKDDIRAKDNARIEAQLETDRADAERVLTEKEQRVADVQAVRDQFGFIGSEYSVFSMALDAGMEVMRPEDVTPEQARQLLGEWKQRAENEARATAAADAAKAGDVQQQAIARPRHELDPRINEAIGKQAQRIYEVIQNTKDEDKRSWRSRQGMGILEAIVANGGLNRERSADIIGESNPKGMPGLWREHKGHRQGLDITDMARLLADEGHFPIDLNKVGDEGGVIQTTELIQKAISGKDVRSFAAAGLSDVGANAAQAAALGLADNWYYELKKDAGGRGKLLGAVEKIIKDNGADVGATVEKVKAFIVEQITGGDLYTNTPPNVEVLKLFGTGDGEINNIVAWYNEHLPAASEPAPVVDSTAPVIESPAPAVANFDAVKWNEDVINAMYGETMDDMKRLAQLLTSVPPELLNEKMGVGGTYKDFVNDAITNLSERVKSSKDIEAVARAESESKAAVEAGNLRGQAVMSRDVLRNQFREAFGFSDADADLYMGVVDAVAKTMAQISGESEDSIYARYYGDVSKADAATYIQERGLQQTISEGQYPLGATEFKNLQASIKAFGSANLSTFIHENGHVFRNILKDMAERTGNARLVADLKAVEGWAGVKDGNWTRDAEERFAVAFERYTSEGRAPVPTLERAFRSFKKLMISIYDAVAGRKFEVDGVEVLLTDELRGVFDRMLGDDGRSVQDEKAGRGDVNFETRYSNYNEIGASKPASTGDAARMWQDKGTPDKPLTNADVEKLNHLFQMGWHGSPNVFDKFSVEKIGTGEGAQAYGWGLYFADSRSVAEWYKNNLSSGNAKVFVDGKETSLNHYWSEVGKAYSTDSALPKDYVAKKLLEEYARTWDWNKVEEQARQWTNGIDNAHDIAAELLPEMKQRITIKEDKGRLYQVELPDDGYLLWDKPLSEQSPQVREAVKNILPEYKTKKFPEGKKFLMANGKMIDSNLIGEDISGRDAYVLMKMKAGDQKSASLALRDAGVNGIKYLNGDSRSAGKGNYNYVIFDDKAVEVKDILFQMGAAKDTGGAADAAGGDAARIWQEMGTDSPHFKQWFGESKVVDKAGKPLVVYHGTKDNFTEFDFNNPNRKDAGWLGTGVYLTTSRETANSYSSLNGEQGANVMQVYARIDNPYYATIEDKARIRSIEKKDGLVAARDAADKWTRDLKAQGYDGVILEYVVGRDLGVLRPSKEIVVFDPAGVKSVANRGEFDKNNPNILFQQGAKMTGEGIPSGAADASGGDMGVSHAEVMNEGWSSQVSPLLEEMRKVLLEQVSNPEARMDGVRDMSPEGQKMLRQYMQQVQGEMATTKLATMRYGELKRDEALLNYGKRYGIDRWADVFFPYQFFYTRSLMGWAARALDKPSWYANYARLRRLQEKYQNDLPERLRGKIKIPMPWLPDWMGDGLYIDPMKSLFTPAQFASPFEKMAQDQQGQLGEAQRVMQEWAADGTYSDKEIAEALKTQSGAVWERALQEAGTRREKEISNPLDFMGAMFGPAWYITTPYNIATGKSKQVSPTPIYNTARALDTATQGTWAQGIGDVAGMLAKPEEMMRQSLGMPEFGEYGDYYIDRQLANMTAEGAVVNGKLVNAEEAQLAMTERTGEVFDAARERVKMEMAMRVPGASALLSGLTAENFGQGVARMAMSSPQSLFGAGMVSEGELKFRGLKDEWNEAWKRADAGDKTAIPNFFDKHPEYQAYLAKGKEPQERLRAFLVGQIWDGYMELGETNQKAARAQMGDLFQKAFLDKETRSYESVPIETLTQWARQFGKKTPAQITEGQKTTALPTENPPALDLYSPDVTRLTDEYFRLRGEKFPHYYEQQQEYYNLPKSERPAYLASHPDLKSYWKWDNQWQDTFPELTPIFKGKVFKTVDTSGWSPYLLDYISQYAMSGEKLPKGARAALEQQWIMEGRPMGSMQTWLDSQIVPAFMYGGAR